MMDLNEKYGYWLSCAVYDMETAEAIFEKTKEAFKWLQTLRP
jgi:hypothetical protein